MNEEDIELFIQEEELKLIEHERSQFQPPKWWLIGLGTIKAESVAVYEDSKRIYREFLLHKSSRDGLTIEEMFKEFEQQQRGEK